MNKVSILQQFKKGLVSNIVTYKNFFVLKYMNEYVRL